MKLKSFLYNEYLYSIITKFITFGVGIVQSVIVARYLGAELKGINAYISSVVSIGSIIITFGMHQAYPYFRKKYGKENIFEDYISVVSSLYIVYFIIGCFLAFLINVPIETKAIFILIPILGYSNIVNYIALIEFPNKRNSWWTIISIIDVLYVAILWLFVNRSVLWGISILLFADVVKSIVYSLILKVKINFRKSQFKLLAEMAKYGFFPMLALLMTTLNYRLDVLMLHQYSYIDDAMIGIYSLGLSLSDKIVIIPDTLKGVLVSKLAKGAPDTEVAKVCRIGFWSSAVLFLLILLFGRFAINLLYGSEFTDSYWVIVITAFGLLAVSYFKLIAQYNIVNKKQKLNVLMLSIAIAVDIILNLVFIPIWGINGAAVATSIGNFVCGIVFITYFCRRCQIDVRDMILFKKSDLDSVRSLFLSKQ